jgi:hypothetical protein
VRHLQTASYIMTAIGVVLVAAALAIDLPMATLLTGMLLFVAGVVKIVMVAVWRGVAGMGSDSSTDEPIARRAALASGRRGAPERKPQ